MAESLKEALQAKTSAAAERKRKAQARRDTEELQGQKSEERNAKARATRFANRHKEEVIEELTLEMDIAADSNKGSISKTWRVQRGERDPEPTEELRRTRRLAEVVGAHFVAQELLVDQIDGREGYEDHSIPSDEGYRPWIETNHIIGLRITWADTPEQTS